MALEFGYLNELEMELVAKKAGMTIEQVRNAQEIYMQAASSLDAPIGPDESDGSLMDVAPPDISVPNPEQQFNIDETKKDLIAALSKILTKPRELQVILYRFGFNTGRPMTLEEVGEIYGVTRERIRQIECKALIKLKRRFNKSGKDEWYMG